MAGAVIESVSSKKLYIGLGLFLACVILGFTVGGLFEAPPRWVSRFSKLILYHLWLNVSLNGTVRKSSPEATS